MSSSERGRVLNAITAAIIAAAIRVHRQLGPGLLEHTYLACLCYELHAAGLAHELQKALPLRYKGVTIDCAYRVDLLVEEQVLVEVKALDSLLAIHSRQLQTYVRLAGCHVGLLLNFGAPTMKAGIKRIVHEFPDEDGARGEKSRSNAETESVQPRNAESAGAATLTVSSRRSTGARTRAD